MNMYYKNLMVCYLTVLAYKTSSEMKAKSATHTLVCQLQLFIVYIVEQHIDFLYDVMTGSQSSYLTRSKHLKYGVFYV